MPLHRHPALLTACLFALLLPAQPAVSADALPAPKAVATAHGAIKHHKPAAAKLEPLPEEPTHYVYLAPDNVSPHLLAVPPKPKSKAWNADIAKIIQMQKYAAPTEVTEARAEQKVRPEIVTSVLGPHFNRETLPLTFKLLDNVAADSKAVTKEAKDYWHIPRPYVADKRVKLQINPLRPTNFAYPSGHTSSSLVLAKVLGDLMPNARPVLLQQAGRVASHRIIAGVHSPHDIAAGQQLGEAIYLQLRAKSAYLQDYSAAAAELSTAGFRPVPGCHPAPQKKNWKHFKSRITE